MADATDLKSVGKSIRVRVPSVGPNKEAAQESIQYNIDHPLNVKIVRKVNGNTYDYYYCEDVVNNEFLKKEFERE